MNRSCRSFLAGLVVLSFLSLSGQAGSAPFQSGFQPIVLPDATILVLGSRPIVGDLDRDLGNLRGEISRVYAKAAKLGLHKGLPSRLIVCLDYGFPVTELWHAFDLEPDEAYFSRLKKDLLQINSMPRDNHLREEEKWRLWRKHPHLNGLPPLVYCKDGSGGLLTADPEKIDAFIARIRESLGRSIGEAGELYHINRNGVFERDTYLYGTGCIYIDARGLKAPQRIYDNIIHEVGHHLFENHFLRKVRDEFGIASTDQAMALRTHLIDLDELFADYMAISNGKVIGFSIHQYRDIKVPQDFKRYFSDERTLEDFIAKWRRDKKMAFLYTEPHNCMNPTRSFIWQVKRAFRLPVTDRLFVDAVNRRLRTFFQADVPRYPHKKTFPQVDDRFILDGYPEDITTANLRFVTEFTAAARLILSPAQREEYNRIGLRIFGRVFPRCTVAD